MRLPVIGTAYAHGRSAVTARVMENLWAERRSDSEKAPVIVTHVPAAVDVMTGDYTSIYRDPVGAVIAAGPTNLYSLNLTAGTVTTTQTLPDAAGTPIFFASSGARVLGVHPNYAFQAVIGSSIAAVTVSGQAPYDCAYYAGYFLLYMFSGRFYWSPDGTTWDALDFANTEAAGDGGLRVVVYADMLAFFGTTTIEFWGRTGNADKPFQLIQGSVRRFTLGTNLSLSMVGEQPFFWGSPEGRTAGLYTLDGMTPVRLSTDDIERALADTSFVYVSGFGLLGHTIVAVHAPDTGATYWYDLSTGIWSRMTGGTPYAGQHQFIEFGSKIFGLRYALGAIYRLNPAAADSVARTLVTDNVVSPDLDRFVLDKVRLDVQTADTVSLEVSRDGGDTWGSARSAIASSARGVQGAVQFDRYGTASQFTLRIKATGQFALSNIVINPRN
jgi:hypothetical protein